MERVVSSMCRQSCDVLGPRICHHCLKICQREKGSRKYEASFPSLQASQQTFTASTLVPRVLPELSKREIQDRVARGDIRTVRFRSCLEQRSSRAQRSLTEQRSVSEHGSLSAISDTSRDKSSSSGALSVQSASDTGIHTPDKHTRKHKSAAYLYFSSIGDLKCKIQNGMAGKQLRLDFSKAHDDQDDTVDEGQPVFVSTRGGNRGKENTSKYKAFYEPPLLTKVCQNTPPSFFAGSELPYRLPERLPLTASEAKGNIKPTP